VKALQAEHAAAGRRLSPERADSNFTPAGSIRLTIAREAMCTHGWWRRLLCKLGPASKPQTAAEAALPDDMELEDLGSDTTSTATSSTAASSSFGWSISQVQRTNTAHRA
jgi:hypothetical protein